MRLLGFLALAAPVVLGILLLGQPATLSWLGDSERSVVAALAAATIGVYLTTGVVQLRSNLRLRRLVKAAEKIADGDYTVGVSTRGSAGLEHAWRARSTGSRSRSRTPTTGPRSIG